MGVVVDLTAATICFLGQCYPTLIGETTPVGEYQMIQRNVVSPGYGGDVIQFKQDGDTVLAIHRIWLGSPGQRRLQRLESPVSTDRRITDGCVNISPEVYERLKDCCIDLTLTIK